MLGRLTLRGGLCTPACWAPNLRGDYSRSPLPLRGGLWFAVVRKHRDDNHIRYSSKVQARKLIIMRSYWYKRKLFSMSSNWLGSHWRIQSSLKSDWYLVYVRNRNTLKRRPQRVGRLNSSRRTQKHFNLMSHCERNVASVPTWLRLWRLSWCSGKLFVQVARVAAR